MCLSIDSNTSTSLIVQRDKVIAQKLHVNQSIVQRDKMAALKTLVFIFLTVTLLGGAFGLSEEEFQVSFIVLR